MGQRRYKENYAALKVARLKLEMENCVRSTAVKLWTSGGVLPSGKEEMAMNSLFTQHDMT